MKRAVQIFTLFLIGTLAASCSKSDIEHENSFEKSYKVWKKFKESSGDSYRYEVGGGSWVGTGWETIITVKKGKVVERAFTYRVSDSKGGEIEEKGYTWIEKEDELGSHKGTAAAALFTLDEVYERAKSEWLVKRKNVKVYFEANNDGMISSCGLIEDGCQDDCFRGISINFIEPL